MGSTSSKIWLQKVKENEFYGEETEKVIKELKSTLIEH